jgi:hypothetical protein
MEGSGMQQWSKGLMHKAAAISEEGEDVWWDLLEGRRAEGQKANNRVDWNAGSDSTLRRGQLPLK